MNEAMLDFLGGLVLGILAGGNIAFFALAILVASKEDKREAQLKAEIKRLTEKLKTVRIETINEVVNRLIDRFSCGTDDYQCIAILGVKDTIKNLAKEIRGDNNA